MNKINFFMKKFIKAGIFIIIAAIFAAYFLIDGDNIGSRPADAAGEWQKPRIYLSGENNR